MSPKSNVLFTLNRTTHNGYTHYEWYDLTWIRRYITSKHCSAMFQNLMLDSNFRQCKGKNHGQICHCANSVSHMSLHWRWTKGFHELCNITLYIVEVSGQMPLIWCLFIKPVAYWRPKYVAESKVFYCSLVLLLIFGLQFWLENILLK